MAERKTFRLEVISPERIFYTGDAEMVELTTTEGDIGIYADHIPLTTIVAPGVMTITEPGGVLKEAAVLEGFMEITPDKVTILAQSCEWPEEIDINRAAEAKARAERRLKSADENINNIAFRGISFYFLLFGEEEAGESAHETQSFSTQLRKPKNSLWKPLRNYGKIVNNRVVAITYEGESLLWLLR